MAAVAPAQVEPKTQLNQFLQRKCDRQITKTDIAYNAQKHGNAYQATITLTCLGGIAFVGELMATKTLAESAAASQVLKHFESEIAAFAAQPKEKKRPASAMSGGVGISGPSDKVQKTDGEQTPSGPIPPKKEINDICVKIMKRVLTKEEVVYSTRAVAGGFQSTLHLSCLPGVYGQNQFTGTVCSNKKESECSVATIAVQTIKADEEFSEVLNKPKENKKGKGKGKSKGKGKGKGKDDDEEAWGWGGFDPMMAMMMMPMMMGGGWVGGGNGGKKKDAGKRERVSTAKVSGTVEEWKGSFGWVKLSKPFEHEKASMHGGKVYLAKSDIPSGQEIKAGLALSFHLYADKSGLGAEDVST